MQTVSPQQVVCVKFAMSGYSGCFFSAVMLLVGVTTGMT